METVESTSESSIIKNKKTQNPDGAENGDTVECAKSKRKNRNKQKSQINGNENGGYVKHDQNLNQESMSSDHFEVNDTMNKNNDCNEEKDEKNEEKATNNTPENSIINSDDSVVNDVNNKTQMTENNKNLEEPPTTKVISTNGDVNGDLKDTVSNVTKNETDSSTNKDNSQLEISISSEADTNECIPSEEKTNGEINDLSSFFGENHENSKNCDSTEEVTKNDTKELNGSHNENLTDLQVSPDSATKEDSYFSHKISNFLGKWNSSPDQKQDIETSSTTTKNIPASDEIVLPHPYLSKVTGRPGIRDKTNSNQHNFSFNEEEIKTPKNYGMSLNDSFRVRTDPARLNHSDLHENITLRKFRGKRCLNATDEPEGGDGDENNIKIKRQKVIEKTSESGFFGNILLSPFRKKSLDNEEVFKLKTEESKLSRFLSPFWFWKKSASDPKMKILKNVHIP